MKIAIIGTGLMGGSLALDLKKYAIAEEVIGIDNNPVHLEEAILLKVIDRYESLKDGVPEADLIILATPINITQKLLPQVLDLMDEKAVVTDIGSLKLPICKLANEHKKRAQFVACHPIAGTEFSGPSAALQGLFKNKVNIICDSENSNQEAVKLVSSLFEKLGSKNIWMNAETHDKHITYVSHLSHITSFALSLTVQALESSQENIYHMAGSGFASTVRLAKSNAHMWVPIFEENKENMLHAIDAYIEQLTQLKEMIQKGDSPQMRKSIEKANLIRKVLPS